MGPILPDKIARYEIRRELGRGMMGVVYEAFDPDLDRTIALKTISLAFAVSADEHASFEKRFLAEARAAARLSHPGIVVVHDVGHDADTGTLYIALEYLHGRSLAEVLRDGAPLPWREALRLAARLAEALHHAHERGIVHRDVKPANIMVLASGQPKMMDFGIAKLPASQLTATGQFFGTPAYMSPEQLAGEAADGRSDLFALGAVLYRMLTGQDAFSGPSVAAVLARVARHEPAPPSTIVAGLPAGVDEVVARALAKDPRSRYADGAALASDLERVLSADGSGAAAPAPASGPAGAPPLRSRPRRWVLGVIAGVVALAAAWALLPRGALTIPSMAAPPARLAVTLEHPLRTGVLRVFVDDTPAVEQPLESTVVNDLVVFQTRKGRAVVEVEVAPGEHVVRIEVVSGSFSDSRRIRGTFESGATRRLHAKIGGLVSKQLSAWWAS